MPEVAKEKCEVKSGAGACFRSLTNSRWNVESFRIKVNDKGNKVSIIKVTEKKFDFSSRLPVLMFAIRVENVACRQTSGNYARMYLPLLLTRMYLIYT